MGVNPRFASQSECQRKLPLTISRKTVSAAPHHGRHPDLIIPFKEYPETGFTVCTDAPSGGEIAINVDVDRDLGII